MLSSAEHAFYHHRVLLNVEMPAIVGILTFISMTNTSESFKASKVVIFQYFIFMSS